jgi:hypothetical protein
MEMKKYLLALTAAIALTTPALAEDLHMKFFQMGIEMQTNLDCHNGGPIHLDDYPLDLDAAQLRYANHQLAHRWAMEGVYYAQSHRHPC